MIGVKVNPSRETEQRYVIQELNRLGVYETLKGEELSKVGYHSLLSMLATARAVAQ